MHWCQISTESDQYNYEYFSSEDVCRLCWNKNADNEILSKYAENSTEISLLDIIKDCLQIEVEDTPFNKVCVDCLNEIKRFYLYKTFCQETDAKLRIILQKGFEDTKIEELPSDLIKSEDLDEAYDTIDVIEPYSDEPVKYEEEDTERKLKSITKVSKRSPTYCNICCLDLESIESLSYHNAELHGIENNGTLFKCFGCEKRFKNRKTRNCHEANNCKGLKDGYKCSICDRYLPKRSMYEFHLRNHRRNTLTELPELIFKCSKCVKLFKTRGLLKLHMVEHGKSFVCEICSRVFTQRVYLHKHKLTHSGVKNHKCPHCEFRATQRSNLTIHIRKHTGERPYSCDMCPQRFISSCSLQSHRRSHRGVKNYHQGSHLGVKKFECPICSKKVGNKITLEEHISSTHLRSEPHLCEHCGATYTRVQGLRRHLAAKHGKRIRLSNKLRGLINVA